MIRHRYSNAQRYLIFFLFWGSKPAPYATVVLAQYPLYELNALVLLPALADAASAAGSAGGVYGLHVPATLFAEAPQAVRGLAVAGWTAFGAVFVTLPLAQRLLRWYGFIGGDGRTCPGLPELSRGAAAAAATYGVVVAGFHLVQQPEIADAVVKVIFSSSSS